MPFDHLDASACRKLWSAAIYCAIKDATRKPRSGMLSDDQENARRWLLGRHAQHVATLIGLDDDRFHDEMCELAERGWQL